MSNFSQRLIAWQKTHGRHHLPWQNTRDPYAIWISEIMLQQTQVAAVLGYYARFMQRFPDITSLARAPQDEVLQYWSGLGYYSRARNLHAAAVQIVQHHAGCFPSDFAAIQSLPGIGRSTAAAIASFAYGQRQPILDGNVKRVLARHYLIEGWPGLPKVEKQLWQLAEELLPDTDMTAYTQGLMDLGATVCTRGRPSCAVCPLNASCRAYAEQRTAELPQPKPRQALPQRQTIMLLFRHGDEILLEKRPPSGIWGGLWSFPEIMATDDPQTIALQRYGLTVDAAAPLPLLVHTFTHFRLHITPQPLQVLAKPLLVQPPALIWMPVTEAIHAALPTPVRKLLLQMKKAA